MSDFVFLTQFFFLTVFLTLCVFCSPKGLKLSEFIKSKKFTGVYYRKNKKGDITYYFTFKDEGKTKYQKVGNKSQGIDEKYVNDIRTTTITNIKNDELPPKIVRKNNSR